MGKRMSLEQYAMEQGKPAEPESLQQVRKENKSLCDKCAEAQKLSLQICKQYRSNTEKIAGLEKEILKGLGEGQDLASLFLKALEALGLLTGDTVIYQQAQAKITSLYAYGMGQQDATEYEIQQIQKRLEHMKNCTCETVDQREIKFAISEQEKRLEQLRACQKQH